MKHQISVGEDHINRGIPQEGDLCPIALAIQDAMPDWEEIAVDGDEMNYVTNNEVWSCELPLEVANFVFDFDALAIVSPFKFEFDDGR